VPDADSLAVADTYKDGGDILGMAANDKTHIAYTGSTTFNADNARQGALLGIDLLNNKKFTAISGLSDGPANFVADPRTNLLYAAAASEGASGRDRYAGRKSSLRRSMFPQRRSLAISSCWIQRTMGSISPPKDCF
jgi:hypothetical protein